MARLPWLRSFVALLLLAPLCAAVGEWHVGHGGLHLAHTAPHAGLADAGDGALAAPEAGTQAPGDCPACLHQLRAGSATLPGVAELPACAVARAGETALPAAPHGRAARAADARGPPAAR
ncbi:MAG: hypothetical protein M5U13_03000 [Thermoanaerobaculia bacterium]|nr:hypothetical protein [Thermoanaerobaculia bacterium]